MPEPYQPLPSLTRRIPPQSRGIEVFGPEILTSPDQVVNAVMGNATGERKKVVAVGNRAVYGLLGDCRDKDLPDKVLAVKGERRGDKPLGITAPWNHWALEGIYDTSQVTHRELRNRLEDPDKLTEWLGALAFLRGPASRDLIDQNDIPDAVLSRPDPDAQTGEPCPPDIQIYSPVGNEAGSEIIGKIIDRGGLPVMSSFNRTGQREIVTTENALKLAEETKVPILIDIPDSERPGEPRGSYPTVGITQSNNRETQLTILRDGWLDWEVMRALLGDIPVVPHTPKHSYPNNVLRFEHLPRRAQYQTGPKLRPYILKKLLGASV